MYLQKLDIHHVRNIHRQTLAPSPRLNCIVGDNGSGKSSLLEAIFILGRARSFRSPSIKTVISEQQDHLLVAGRLMSKQGVGLQFGVRMDGKEVAIHINHEGGRQRSELAYIAPMQLIRPESYALLELPPKARREFFDWGCFNHDEHFLASWRAYRRALAQRNAWLKNPRLAPADVWADELARHGQRVDGLRRQYLGDFLPCFVETAGHFAELEGMALNLVSGWDTEKDLRQLLQADMARDLRHGFTHSGPHRFDFRLMVRQGLARDYLSRGQLKLLVLSLKLAQVRVLSLRHGHAGCVLIDDFSAELDRHNRAKVLAFLSALDCQVFMTATALAEFGEIPRQADHKLFHVEHGKITQQ